MSTSETVKEARNAEKEAKAVSKLVSRKLEGYMNYARREQRFDPSGRGYRTNPLMHKYDVMYKMLEMTEMEADHRKKVKAAEKEEKKEKKLAISPRLAATSRRVTLNHEAERLTNNANTVFETLPVEKLTKIHRYRPHSDNVEDVTDNGKVMNYTRHIGAALHSETYVQYYQKEGLETGSKMKSPRLQKIKPKPKNTEKKSPRENERKDIDKNEDPKQDERYAPKKAAHYMVQNGKPISLDDKEEEKDLRTKKWVKERQTNDKDSNLNKTDSINKNSDDKDHETDEEQLDTTSVISQQSMQSNTSHKSNQSKCSNHSNKSKASTHSNKSKASTNSNKSKGSNHSNKSKGSHQSEKNYCGNLTADEDNSNEDESIKCVGEQVTDKNDDQNNHSEEHFDKVKDNNINNDENHDDHVNDKGQENNMDDQNNNLHDNKSDDNNSNDNKSEQNYSHDDNTEEHNNLGDNETNDKNVKKHHSEDTQSTSSATEIYSSVEHIDRRSTMLN